MEVLKNIGMALILLALFVAGMSAFYGLLWAFFWIGELILGNFFVWLLAIPCMGYLGWILYGAGAEARKNWRHSRT